MSNREAALKEQKRELYHLDNGNDRKIVTTTEDHGPSNLRLLPNLATVVLIIQTVFVRMFNTAVEMDVGAKARVCCETWTLPMHR